MVEVVPRAHLEAAPGDPATRELVAHQTIRTAAKRETTAKASPKSQWGFAGLAATPREQLPAGWAPRWPWGLIPELTHLPACS